jgi:hypothetical protein
MTDKLSIFNTVKIFNFDKNMDFTKSSSETLEVKSTQDTDVLDEPVVKASLSDLYSYLSGPYYIILFVGI